MTDSGLWPLGSKVEGRMLEKHNTLFFFCCSLSESSGRSFIFSRKLDDKKCRDVLSLLNEPRFASFYFSILMSAEPQADDGDAWQVFPETSNSNKTMTICFLSVCLSCFFIFFFSEVSWLLWEEVDKEEDQEKVEAEFIF